MTGKKKIIRNQEKPIQRIRFFVQTLFAGLCLWIGVEFYVFIRYLESGGTTSYFSRPPGVDGFLPISSLMSFYYFLSTGEIQKAHPAGMFIFLGFVFYPVFFVMSNAAIKAFLDSPYNLVADLKMFYFFADISQVSLIVISSLFIFSIVIRNFWCRYLCPYGALLGIVSLLSPLKVKRNSSTCIDCNLCAKACPSNIKVDKMKTVWSDECTSCLNCIDACPVADTLEIHSFIPKRKKISKKLAAITLVSIFIITTGIGILTGNWQNEITKDEYLQHHKNMGSYGHPTGTEGFKKLNEQTLIEKKNEISNSNKN